VRIRKERFGIPILEGKQPNMGWLGPEMSGEEGATFPEKLWWAIDEAKARLSTDNLGSLFDRELLFIDEKSNCQLVLFGMLAKDSDDVLEGHIWVDKAAFQTSNMKSYMGTVLQNMLSELQAQVTLMNEKTASKSLDMEGASKLRIEKAEIKEKLKALLAAQTPLKWVDRVIMWCADKMPSLGASVEGADAPAVLEAALKADTTTEATNKKRMELIAKYG